MMPKTIVRPAKSKEIEKIHRLLERANFNIVPYGIEYQLITVPSPTEGKRWIVGCVGIAEGNRICNLVVEDNHKRKGYGSLLLEKAVSICTEPYLRVRMTNWKAIRLYFKQGFKFQGIRNKSFIMSIYPMKKKVIKIPKTQKFIKKTQPLTLKNYLSHKGQEIDWKKKQLYQKTANFNDLLDFETKHKFKVNKINDQDLLDIVRFHDDSTPVRELVLEIIKNDDHTLRNYKNSNGTVWTKRYSSELYNRWGYKPSASSVRDIGNLLIYYASSDSYFELSHDLDWKAGDFGDGDSCWFAFKSNVREAFFSTGKGYAVKIYNKNDKGIGRCWAYLDTSNLYLFNARGVSQNVISKGLCTEYGLQYKSLQLKCDYPESYVEYMGDVLGQPPNPAKEYTMKWRQHA